MDKSPKLPEEKIPSKQEVISEEIKILIENEIIKITEDQKKTLRAIYEEIFAKIKQLEIKGLYIPEDFLKKTKEKLKKARIEILDESLFEKYLRDFIFKVRAYKII